MALGKAFIEVHADTAPFARELGTQLDAIVKASEKDVRVSARRIGETVSTEAGEGIRRNRSKVDSGVTDALAGTAGIFARLAKTVVLVTHDLGEAAFLGQHVVLLRDGRVVQQGALAELEARPVDPFVTRFIQAQRLPMEGSA